MCEQIQGLHGRDLYKATVLENLRRTNRPPAADLQFVAPPAELSGAPVLPGLVHLDASGSVDEDGSEARYIFRLTDGETGQALAGPLETREPFATLQVSCELPASLHAEVTVTDEEGATDTAAADLALGDAATCSTSLFTCSASNGATSCQPLGGSFTTADLLAAAQQCDPSLTKFSPVLLAASGAAGVKGIGRGGIGGLAGQARVGTTPVDLDSTYGAATTWCYGIGARGIASGGGASSLLRDCATVSQTDPRGVLLVAAGGGGGSDYIYANALGGSGGLAVSTTTGPCPPDCSAASTPDGGGADASVAAGGAGGVGGQGGAGYVAGADGIGGDGGDYDAIGAATFKQGDPKVTGGAGSGGANYIGSICGCGGTGGGGYGGGGSAQDAPGGGGGSYAAPSTVDVEPPALEPIDSAGFLIFTFHAPALAVRPPMVQSVSRTTVKAGGHFTINGTGFIDPLAVKLGGQTVARKKWQALDTGRIVVTTPSGLPTGTLLAVEVEAGAGGSNSNVNITVSGGGGGGGGGGAPVVSMIAPAAVVVGATFTITGSGFTGATAILVGGEALAVWAVDSDTQITATVGSLADPNLYGLPLAVQVVTAAGASNSTENVTVDQS